jgi:hypothetical protein
VKSGVKAGALAGNHNLRVRRCDRRHPSNAGLRSHPT